MKVTALARNSNRARALPAGVTPAVGDLENEDTQRMPAEIAQLLSLALRACTILSVAPAAWFYIVRGIRA